MQGGQKPLEESILSLQLMSNKYKFTDRVVFKNVTVEKDDAIAIATRSD